MELMIYVRRWWWWWCGPEHTLFVLHTCFLVKYVCG